jgi:hypothetical protein
LTLSIIMAAGALARGTTVQGARATPGSESSVRSTPWGEPDLRGTYSPAAAGWPTSCGAIGMIALMRFPIYAGFTHIDQSPGIVRIRNQFSRPRVVFAGGSRGSGSAEHARWEGETLVIETIGVTERLTRLGGETLHYHYLVRDEAAEGWTIAFPLTRAPARSGMRLDNAESCGAATVD